MNQELSTTNREIGQAVVAHVNSGATSDEPLWDECYAPNFTSVEADGMTHTGREEVLKKHQQWLDTHTVHSMKAVGPFVGPSGFSVIYEFDVEAKDGSMPRLTMQEVGVYTVADGKVVREEFRYFMPADD